LKIVALGTGTSQGVPVIGCQCEVCQDVAPNDIRTRSSIYLESEESKVLIDIGPDFRSQFLDNDLDTVDLVLITHEHNDHIIGLDDIRAINFIQKKSVPFYMQRRVLDEVRLRFDYVFKGSSYPGLPQIELHEVSNTPLQFRDLTITPILVHHGRLPILSYRINNIAYITDASHIPDTEWSKLENLDILIINALRKTSHHSHFTLEEALEAAARIGAKETYLTHISHLMGPTSVWERELPPTVRPLQDKMIIHTSSII